MFRARSVSHYSDKKSLGGQVNFSATTFGWSLLLLFVGFDASAQSVMVGKWKCAGGLGDGVLQTMPPAGAIIAQQVVYFAPNAAKFQTALAKGGLNGLYVLAHVHGIHVGAGETSFSVTSIVRDSGGYVYAMIPHRRFRVKGSKTKQAHEFHTHCGGHFDFTSKAQADAVLTAISNGVEINLLAPASRDRKNVGQELDERARDTVNAVLEGKMKEIEFLKVANQGKSPAK
jgi:hypothetical protein